MITTTMNKRIKVPKTVVVCPICGDQVIVEVNEIEEDYDHTWKASEYGIETTCATEPDITDKGFESWLDNHFQFPYIDWIPVTDLVIDWLDKNYRFTSNVGKNNDAED